MCLFLPARRYASAGTCYGPVSVCLTIASRCSTKAAKLIGLVLGMGASFNLPYTVHTHTRLTALCPRLPGWAGTTKVKQIWI